MQTRYFVPTYQDHGQSDTYRLVAYTASEPQGLLAWFATGRSVPSIYGTLSALLEAGRENYLERVREIFGQGPDTNAR